MDRPDPNTYWVIPGHLLAGEYPGHPDPDQARQRLERFLAAGVTFFLDLTEPGELPDYRPLLDQLATAQNLQVVCRQMPIADFGVPTPAAMRNILDAIDQATAAGHLVYLHCWGGIGRTGTTVGCHLVRHGSTGPQALDQLRQLFSRMDKASRRQHSPETPEQVQFILDWQK